ncbi:MAG: hypothetical protein ACRYFS_25810 [Janthinobacterium lividum]
MISAPLRETLNSKPSIKTHGHLALLEWDDKALPVAPAKSIPADFPIRKSVMDRCYDGGVIVLMAVSIAAMAASLARF